MQIPLIDLEQQVQQLKPAVLAKVAQLLDDKAFIMGPEVSGLEERFCQLAGTGYSLSCNSGTDALVLILEALGIGAGDEVITTPFTFFATAESISRVSAKPVFADVRPDTFNIDVNCIEQLITERTKAILPVHIFGQPVEMEALLGIAERHGLKVVEDACQAIGATYKFADGTCKPVGALGHAAAFSFYPTKNLGAYGDGGMITTDDEQLAVLIRALRAHGGGVAGKQAYEQLTGRKIALATDQADADSTVYDPSKYYNFFIGVNSRLDALQAAVLAVKLEHLTAWNSARQRLSKRYTELLAERGLLDKLQPQAVPANVDSVWHLYVVQCRERAALAAYLKRQGVATGIYYPVPLHLQVVYQSGRHALGYRLGDLPVSEALCKRTMALPMFPEMTEAQQQYVVDMIAQFYR